MVFNWLDTELTHNTDLTGLSETHGPLAGVRMDTSDSRDLTQLLVELTSLLLMELDARMVLLKSLVSFFRLGNLII